MWFTAAFGMNLSRRVFDVFGVCLLLLVARNPAEDRYRVTIKCGPVVWFDDYATSHVVVTVTNGPTWSDARGRVWSVPLQSPSLLTNRLL